MPKENSFGQDYALCAKCSIESGGCCKTNPREAVYCFPISRAEVKRILPYAQLSEKTNETIAPMEGEPEGTELICAKEDNKLEFIDAMKSLFLGKDDKVDELFPKGGEHFRLRLKKDGACVFLSDQGCRLPRSVRPWYCLLFPAWFQGEFITIFYSDKCLAIRGLQDPVKALKRIGMEPEEALYFFNKLLVDWGFSQKKL